MSFFYKFLLFICLISLTTAAVGMPPKRGGVDDEREGSAATAISSPLPADRKASSPTPLQRMPAAVATPATPAAAIAAADIEETPGKLLAQRQAEVLNKKSFEEILGSEVVADWGIEWEKFAEVQESPHSTAKLLNASRIMGKMRAQARKRYDPPFSTLLQQVTEVKFRMEGVHLERLEGIVGKYFQQHFPGSEVTFEIKDSGIQLGTIATIKESEGRSHTFYIKTHSEGKLASKSSAAKLVNSRELLVYKILENLGIGCEAHFCARSPEDVYIATRDAGEGGHFFLFKKALEDEDGLGAALWGSLGALDKSPRQSDKAAVESWIAEDSVGQQFVQQVSTLDAVSRLLRLHDFLNNPDNFGFFRAQSAPFAARILDFRTPTAQEFPIEEFLFTDAHVRSFLAGNGLFNYVSAHKTLCFILRERLQEQRVRTTLSVLTEGPLRGLEEAINRSYEGVADYLQGAGVFGAYLDKLMDDLTTYRDTLQQNRRFFIEKLQSWHPEGQGGPR